MDDWLMPGIPRTIADEPDMETVRRIRASITSDTGQVVESGLLLPCPFCGARPYVQVHELGDTCVEARVVCPMCHVSTVRECQGWKVSYLGDDLTRTLAMGRAISLWNRRSERTAFIEVSHGTHGPRPRFPGDVWTMHHVCSACGGAVDGGDHYCKHCGARIIKEDE